MQTILGKYSIYIKIYLYLYLWKVNKLKKNLNVDIFGVLNNCALTEKFQKSQDFENFSLQNYTKIDSKQI